MPNELKPSQTNEYDTLLFPERIGRVDFFWRMFLVCVTFCVGAYVCSLFPENSNLRLALALALGTVLLMYPVTFILVPRVRDLGLPSLAIAFLLVPVLNALLVIALFFAPKDYWHTLRGKKLR